MLALGLVSCARGPAPGDLAGWNVLLITIDTLRADHVGFMGYDGVETPVLDELAASGVVFDGAVSSAPVTLPAHATILTGLYPPSHGALDNGFYSLPEGVPTLATILEQEGYDTAAVIGAYVLVERTGLDVGFDLYDDDFTKPRGRGQAYRERRASEVTARAAAWLEGRSSDAPFFLWAHYFDPHAPYAAPEPYATRYRLRPYDGEIAYTDEAIGHLLEAVRAAGELDRTLVIVTADHGEAFGDGGEMTHGMLLRGSTLRVPFVLSGAGRVAKGTRVREVVGTVDVAPTVLDLLGVDRPSGLHGVSLLPALQGEAGDERYVYTETRLPADEFGWSMLAGVRGDQWAWVRAPRPELYDLEADPAEMNSLHEARPGLAGRLDGLVGEILEGGRESVARAHLSDEQVSALRSLGYLVSHEPPPSTGEDPKDMMYIQAELNLLMNYLERNEPERVLEGVEELLEKTPRNTELLTLRAQANARLGNLEPAIADMRECLAAGGSLEVDGTLLAMWLNQAGKSGEAEALLRSFIEAEPDFAQHSYNLGNLLGELERDEEAVAAYEQAIRLDPENVPALVNLGFALSRLEGDARDVDRAREVIDRAIALAHDDVPALMKIDLCKNLGLPDEGLAVAQELQRKPQLRGITRQQLADALRRLQGSDE